MCAVLLVLLLCVHSWEQVHVAAETPPAFGWGGRWPPNHLWPADIRANLRLPAPPADGRSAAVASVPWYRRDLSPGPLGSTVSMYCGDAVTPVPNVQRIRATREEGIYAFEPICGASANYSMYYVTFVPGNNTDASEPWRRANNLTDADIARGHWTANLNATFVGFENRDNFTGFSEMELAASDSEVEAALTQCSADSGANCPFLLFPEDRAHVIRMHNFAVHRWFTAEYARERKHGLHIQGQRDEYVSFQIGVLATVELRDLNVTFTPLKSSTVQHDGVPVESLHCVNVAGFDDRGHAYRPRVNVSARRVQPLWMGVMVPADTIASVYHGVVTVTATGPNGKAYSLSVPLSLDVSTKTADQHGDTEGWRASRVRWLDSTLGIDDELVYPFTPMVVQGSGQHATVDLLGRRLTLDGTSGSGLPTRINSWGAELLHSPMRFDVEIGKKLTRWNATSGSLSWPHKGKASVSWQSAATSTNGNLRKETTIVAEADGYLEVQIKLTPVGQSVVLSRTRLVVPMNGSAGTSSFQMGLGCELATV